METAIMQPRCKIELCHNVRNYERLLRSNCYSRISFITFKERKYGSIKFPAVFLYAPCSVNFASFAKLSHYEQYLRSLLFAHKLRGLSKGEKLCIIELPFTWNWYFLLSNNKRHNQRKYSNHLTELHAYETSIKATYSHERSE